MFFGHKQVSAFFKALTSWQNANLTSPCNTGNVQRETFSKTPVEVRVPNINWPALPSGVRPSFQVMSFPQSVFQVCKTSNEWPLDYGPADLLGKALPNLIAHLHLGLCLILKEFAKLPEMFQWDENVWVTQASKTRRMAVRRQPDPFLRAPPWPLTTLIFCRDVRLTPWAWCPNFIVGTRLVNTNLWP